MSFEIAASKQVAKDVIRSKAFDAEAEVQSGGLAFPWSEPDVCRVALQWY